MRRSAKHAEVLLLFLEGRHFPLGDGDHGFTPTCKAGASEGFLAQRCLKLLPRIGP
jgi:hypothetical protein